MALLVEALTLYRKIGNRVGEVHALNGLGQALSAAGQPHSGLVQYATALTLAAKIGDRYEPCPAA